MAEERPGRGRRVGTAGAREEDAVVGLDDVAAPGDEQRRLRVAAGNSVARANRARQAAVIGTIIFVP